MIEYETNDRNWETSKQHYSKLFVLDLQATWKYFLKFYVISYSFLYASLPPHHRFQYTFTGVTLPFSLYFKNQLS